MMTFTDVQYQLYKYLSEKDYILVDLLYINAIFVDRKYIQLLEPLTDSEAYVAGYKNRIDKYELLKHNKKFDELLHMDSSEVINYIEDLFKNTKVSTILRNLNFVIIEKLIIYAPD